MKIQKEVWCLHCDSRHGSDLLFFNSADELIAWQYEQATDFWQDVFDCPFPQEMAADEAIDKYREAIGDRLDGEYWQWDSHFVEIEVPDAVDHQPLRDACRGVLATWEEGNLAAAVNLMERELDLIEGVTLRTEAPPATMDDGIKDLVDRFGYHGEHPRYDLDSWQEEVINENTRLGYWEWVIHQIESKEEEN